MGNRAYKASELALPLGAVCGLDGETQLLVTEEARLTGHSLASLQAGRVRAAARTRSKVTHVHLSCRDGENFRVRTAGAECAHVTGDYREPAIWEALAGYGFEPDFAEFMMTDARRSAGLWTVTDDGSAIVFLTHNGDSATLVTSELPPEGMRFRLAGDGVTVTEVPA